jgi:signal transduction histidine kinase
MALIQDITERKELEEELRRLKGKALETLQGREAILEALGHCAEILLATTSWQDNIAEVLKRLGEAAQVSRVCIFRNQAERDSVFITSQHYEWAAPGISPHLDNPEFQDFPLETNGFSRWVKTMRQGRPILGLVKDFPESEQRVLLEHDIDSILVTPIFVAEKWWGFIGLDDCTAERRWSPPEIGALNFGYGDPPQETKKLQEIAYRYGVTIDELRDRISSLDSRPAFVIQIAKNRASSLANLIGTIVERKQAEETLHKSYARLEEAERIAHLGHWEAIIPANKVIWSEETYRIFQLDPRQTEASYETFVSRVHPEDRAMMEADIAEALAGRKPHSIDHRIVLPDGSIRWVHEEGAVTINETGQAVRFMGTIRDITAAKQAEEALKESESNMRHLASQLMTAQETERQRVSLELHDELGQSLQVLKLMIAEGMANLRPDQTDLKNHCLSLQNYLKGIIENVRRLSHELSPTILEDLNLTAAIKFLLTTLCQHYGIETFRHRLYNIDPYF